MIEYLAMMSPALVVSAVIIMVAFAVVGWTSRDAHYCCAHEVDDHELLGPPGFQVYCKPCGGTHRVAQDRTMRLPSRPERACGVSWCRDRGPRCIACEGQP